MDENEIKYFIEAALLAAGRPLTVDQLHYLFGANAAPDKPLIRRAIDNLQADYANRGLAITEVASGFRTQIKASMADRLQKLWEERPPRYSRALFETLALIAYRQPMTRGEIEEIRGVAVSSNIVRSLLEREWIRVVGHRDVPGRPAMFGTTRLFLDYFGLKKLDDLPPLADLSDWESLRVQLNLPDVENDDAEPESADVTELPILFADFADKDETSGESSGDDQAGEAAATADDASECEPIVATQWPAPSKNTPAIDEAEGERDDDAAEEEDKDASMSR